ncbi:hypothetical protein Ssi03_33450 [Sphaerisporangium siamense]|uniref:Copper(I)-binding protein n=1 Tax=Sphaerisporangium siamense TaxID=795645 RepID=A0A7W7D4E7_9ACTN|nr:copper chaperone PCu(A)C [Sphaerisporangium siamense]MBB4698586.1 copper(I)-binding protein [Sphaerisporangium siamense]GII85355.1 hypothetical protein Ssi03_33450 [Sphaerisporangium siamense]
MTSTSRRRVIIATALLAAVPALAACGAGTDANTSSAYAPTEANVLIDGEGSAKTYGRNGIKIAQAFALGPDSGQQIASGGSVPLYISMVNDGDGADTLESVAINDRSATSVKGGAIQLPPGQLVNTGRPSQIILEGVQKPLRGGESISLTLRFSNAGDIAMRIPVVTRSREYASLSPAPSAAPSTSATPSGTPTPTPSATPSTDPTADS